MSNEKTRKELLIENAKLKLEKRATLAALQLGCSMGVLPDIVNRTVVAFDCGGLKEGELTALGVHATPEAFVDALKSDPEAEHLFEGSKETSPTPSAAPLSRSKMTDDQQSEYIHRHGGEKYLKLPE